MPQRLMQCSVCKKSEWHEAPKPYARPVGCKCSCGHAYDEDLPKRTRAFAIGNRPWNEEGRSLSYAFNPANIAGIGATCPETARAIDPKDGTLVFENDGHQKRVYAEMKSELARDAEEKAARGEAEVTANQAFLGGANLDLDSAESIPEDAFAGVKKDA